VKRHCARMPRPGAFVGEQGRAAAHEHEISPRLIASAVQLIAAYLAAGETLISRTDLALECSERQMRRVIAYLEMRGHVQRQADRDLIRPVGDQGELI
jgi:hypothetical protein